MHRAPSKRSHLGILPVWLTLAGCALQTGSRQGNETLVAQQVRAALDRLAQADRDLDAPAVLAMLAPDFYMYQDGTRQGYERTVEQIAASLPSLQSFETAFSNIEILVLSDDAALSSMTFLDRIIDADGNEHQAHGPNTMLWRRIDGAWRIAYLQADHYPTATEGSAQRR